MTESMMEKIASALVELGYQNVLTDNGTVHYEELDGTKHFLLEHVDEKVTRYIVTCVDGGYTRSGKDVVLGSFKTKAEAQEYVKNDIDAWYSRNCDEGVEIDYDKMSAHFDYDSNYGCEWQIHEVVIKV